MGDWREDFVEDVSKMLNLPPEAVEKFIEIVNKGEEEALDEWADQYGISDETLLLLSAMLIMYSTHDKVYETLSNLSLRVDEAVNLVGTLVANMANEFPDASRLIIAQALLIAAVQVEDRRLREALVNLANGLASDRASAQSQQS